MPQFSLLVFFSSFFLFWLLHVLMQRTKSLGPSFVLRSDVLEMDVKVNDEIGQSSNIHMRSSKSVNSSGSVRVVQLAEVQYLKVVASIILTIAAFYPVFEGQLIESYKRLFVDFDPSIIHAPFVQFAAAVTLSWYLFETIVLLQYNKLVWSSVLHHWLTSISAVSVLLGYFNPAAIMYGVMMVALSFPMSFLMGFRVHKANRYPNLMKKLHRIVFYYYLATLVINIVGQLVVLYLGYRSEFFSSLYIITILVFIVAWCYDDIQILKSLRTSESRPFSLLNFEGIKQ